jgi:succinate dehydrogenase/fumarate reductase flavoprotein subunit
MNEEKKQCDVLCVVGGIAGLDAAICASEMGAKVVVAEKTNTMRKSPKFEAKNGAFQN